jgi:hypothetical protein
MQYAQVEHKYKLAIANWKEARDLCDVICTFNEEKKKDDQ